MPVGFDPATPELMHEINRILKKYPFFGSRQMAAYLPQSGFSAGRYRVHRLMGIMGFQAIYKGPNTRNKHPEHRMYPYLLRKLPITQPNHAAQSGLVQRHHLHPSQKRLSVSGGDHGLGNAKTADWAALKYAGCSLLC